MVSSVASASRPGRPGRGRPFDQFSGAAGTTL